MTKMSPEERESERILRQASFDSGITLRERLDNATDIRPDPVNDLKDPIEVHGRTIAFAVVCLITGVLSYCLLGLVRS